MSMIAAERRARLCAPAGLAIAIALPASPAFANNYGESLARQFQTANDRAAQAAILGMIEQRQAGVYAAPNYTTKIARQVNCSISAVATGNGGARSAVANSPTTEGATSTAIGNCNASSIGESVGLFSAA